MPDAKAHTPVIINAVQMHIIFLVFIKSDPFLILFYKSSYQITIVQVKIKQIRCYSNSMFKRTTSVIEIEPSQLTITTNYT